MTPAMTRFLDQLREDGAGVYPALLFLPEGIREDAAALHAFHLETGNIAYRVSEPAPGEIRLQWWREVLAPTDGIDRTDEATANPLAAKLVGMIAQYKLPRDGFDRYLEARVFDLYNDAMPDRVTFEAYCGETDSFILQMTCQMAGYEMDRNFADACGHAGVAIAITKRLGLLARDRAAGRTWLPLDLLRSAGLDRESWLGEPGEQHAMAVSAFQALGREHAGKAARAARKLPKEAQALFLPLAVERPALAGNHDPRKALTDGIPVSPLRRQLSLWNAAMRGL